MSTPKQSDAAFRVDGRQALVTGGASGIGESTVKELVRAGAFVWVADINLPAAERLAASTGSAQALHLDVTSPESIAKAVAQVEKLDILVNNAGIGHVGSIETTEPEDFDRLLNVNVRAVYLVTRAFLPRLLAARDDRQVGAIINMGSVAGQVGIRQRFAYCTSKGAVLAMTYSIARDFLKKNIRCNAISPARVHTGFVDGYLAKNYPGKEAEMFDKLSAAQPIGRMAKPEEVANLALYLCSDEASFLTGVDYPLDGGFVNLRG